MKIRKIFRHFLTHIFGFHECLECEKYGSCDEKVWLHNEKECVYNQRHNAH
jgi:hypothetical protein